jgi:hypothetical protein
MTTWVIKSQTSDPKRALEIIENWRNTEQEVWIEDERGQQVDEGTLKGMEIKQTTHNRGELGIAVLFWLAAATVGLGALYLLGAWVDKTW